jgi:hypothetical protein
MPRFTITRILICDKHRWLVEGRISVAGKVAAEDYSRLFATKAKAESDAAKQERIEAQAEEYITERNAARLANAERYLAERAAPKETDQIAMPI